MLTHTHFIFLPREPLLAAANEFDCAGEPALQPAVWTIREHDRTGREYSREFLEQSFWAVFLANLVEDSPESERVKSFRERCMALGFDGCWSVQATKVGGNAAELVGEASAAREFLSRHRVIA